MNQAYSAQQPKKAIKVMYQQYYNLGRNVHILSKPSVFSSKMEKAFAHPPINKQ